MQAGAQVDDPVAGDHAEARPAVQSIAGKTHVARSPKSSRANPCEPVLGCDVLEVGASTVTVLPLSPVRGERIGVGGDDSAVSRLQRPARTGLAAGGARRRCGARRRAATLST